LLFTRGGGFDALFLEMGVAISLDLDSGELMSSHKLEIALLLRTAAATFLCLAAFSEGGRVCAQADLPQEIERALKNNAAALSPLTVTWERRRTSYLAGPDVLARFQIHSTALAFMAPEKVRFMWKDGMVYTYFWRYYPQLTPDGKAMTGKLALQEQEVSFNREAYYSGNPSLGNPLLIIEPAGKLIDKGSKALVGACPYLDQAGFRMPQTIAELNSKQPTTDLQAYLAEGARVMEIGKEKLDDATCVAIDLLKEKRKHRFLLDPSKNYALRRRMAWSLTGRLELSIACSDFVKLSGPDHWLPRRIRRERYHPDDSPGKPSLIETLAVSELHNNPIAPSQFVLNYSKAGDSVSDGRLPGGDKYPSGRVYYQVPVNPEDLDAAIQAATEGKPFSPRWFRLDNRRTWFLIVVNVVALLILGALIRRYIKKKPSLKDNASERPQP
jgi:hypothetical protein